MGFYESSYTTTHDTFILNSEVAVKIFNVYYNNMETLGSSELILFFFSHVKKMVVENTFEGKDVLLRVSILLFVPLK